jgi:ribosomal protein L37AE/L43A
MSTETALRSVTVLQPCPYCTNGTVVDGNGMVWKCSHCRGMGVISLDPPATGKRFLRLLARVRERQHQLQQYTPVEAF